MSSYYFRIQPAGLPLEGHRSESSDGVRDGVDVFEKPCDTFHTDAPRQMYGDEVLVIEGGVAWPNGDVEGVRIDPATATVIARFAWADWCEAFNAVDPDVDEDDIEWIDGALAGR